MVLVASMMFLAPAIARMLEWMTSGLPFLTFIITSIAIMFTFPIALVAHDWWKNKQFPVYPAIGLAVMTAIITLNFTIPATGWGMAFFLQHLN
jgi:hypothetical protein